MQTGQHDFEENATLEYYERNASAFADDTSNANMSSILNEFASLLPDSATVLDWGCGTGRDSRSLLNLGFSVVSTDASKEMCDLARELFDIEARCESFDDLDAEAAFDGIWACASLLHAPKSGLPNLLRKAHRALKPDGVLYASFKRGDFEGVRNGRWFTDLDAESLTALLQPSFAIIRIWITGDVRPGREDEEWLNCLATKRS